MWGRLTTCRGLLTCGFAPIGNRRQVINLPHIFLCILVRDAEVSWMRHRDSSEQRFLRNVRVRHPNFRVYHGDPHQCIRRRV